MKVKAGRELLSEHDAAFHNYVAYLSHFLSPNDNRFHSGFRARVNRELAKYRSMTGPLKMTILHDAYFNCTEAEIRDYFTPFPKELITPAPGAKIGSFLHDIVPMVAIGYEQ